MPFSDNLCRCYINKKNGKIIYFGFEFETPWQKSLRKLRNTFRNEYVRKKDKTKNLYFLTLTYANSSVNDALPNDVRLFQNRLKQYNRNKGFHEWNKQMRIGWKMEFDSSGSREFNPHFHLLIESPFRLSLPKIQAWWQKGFVKRDVVQSRKKALVYISKYFSKTTYKHSNYSRNHPKAKLWSKTRNMKTPKTKYRYYGIFYYTFARELARISRIKTLVHHIIEKIKILHSYLIAALNKIDWWRDDQLESCYIEYTKSKLMPVIESYTNYITVES